jgi:hypothetical protein
MLYPVFILLKGKGKKFLNMFTGILAVPGVMYIVLPLPFFVLQFTVPAGFLSVGNGGWGFLFYVWFLLAGFILYSDELLLRSIVKQRWISLILSLILSVAGLTMIFSYEELGNMMRFVLSGIGYVGSWAILLCIIGFAIQYLRNENSFLGYSNEAGIAFYILHQPIIVSLAFFIVAWGLPDLLTFVAAALFSFMIIMILYEYGIRRFNFSRFLFGMKPVRSTRTD